MNLIERLRKGIVTSAPYEPQYTVPPAAICFEAADALERHEKQLAAEKYAADNYRTLLDESDHAYAELKDEVNKWKTSYSNAMDVNTDLRAKLAERSAEYLAAHITYDKGYQAGRQDAEDAKYDEDEVLAETARYRAEVERLTAARDLLLDQLASDRKQYLDMKVEWDALAADLAKYKGICDSLLHDLDANASHCDALAAGACCEPDGLTADDGGVIYCQIAKELNARTPLSRTQILNIHALPNWPRTQFADKGYGIALDTVSVVDFVRMIEAVIQGAGK